MGKGFRRMALLALCGALAGVTAAVAQSAGSHRTASLPASTAETMPQRWYVLESGNLVSYEEQSGLTELTAPETLAIAGEVQVNHEESTSSLPPLSNCLMKGRETIADPTEASAAGTAELTELEISCEKATGSLNSGQPYPCTRLGEPFELKAVGGPWPATLVPGPPKKHGYPHGEAKESFAKVELEVLCLQSREHGIYTGTLSPLVTLGRFAFSKATAELEEPVSKHHLFLQTKATGVFITTPRYKNVRVNHEGL